MVVVGLILALGTIDAHGQQVSVSLDRDVYPVPFLNSEFIPDGTLTMYVTINDPNSVSTNSGDKIARYLADSTQGPLKISVSRESDTVIIATAGGEAPGGSILTVGTEPAGDQYELGPISESNPGEFELSLPVLYTDGPADGRCPTADNSGTRFADADGNAQDGNFCILKDDTITVEYTYSDDAGMQQTVSDSAKFNLRDAELRIDANIYVIGHDMPLYIDDPDLDLDSKKQDTYDLDLITWASEAGTLTMGNAGGEEHEFRPVPDYFEETGSNTGTFRIILGVPKDLAGVKLDRGEHIVMSHTDTGPSNATFVGETSSVTAVDLFTSNFGAKIELDKPTYTWTDRVYITIIAHDYNFNPDRPDEIGDHDAQVTISTSKGTLERYSLVETGADTGHFAGEVTLTGFTYDVDGHSVLDNQIDRAYGMGPDGGLLPAMPEDGITIAVAVTQDETLVKTWNIWWNVGTVEIFLDGPPEIPRTGTLRVTDPDMNLDPTMEEELEITFHSDSDTDGDDVLLTEISPAAGIFEATVNFVSDSTGRNNLLVAANDTVYATYVDYTLPDSYGTSRDINGTANMADAGSVATPIPDETPETVPDETPGTTDDTPDTNSTSTNTQDPPETRTVDRSNWDIGKVKWTESGYNAETETATFQVTDPDQNTNTNSPDSFGVNVRSDTDSAGIAIMVTETGVATGVFEGEVAFTLDGRSSNSTLLVSSGDTITGEYEDHTPSAAYMVKDRPSVTDTATINVINVKEPDPNISIKLDKETYTWTDRVYINITSPDHNTDDRGRDKIGNAENPIRVATRGGHIDLYELEETDINTGVFVGELVLAGFAHDADGDASTGAGGNDVTDSEARGSGSKGGILPADNEDAVSVSFEYIDGKVIANNSAIQWNKGNASWIGLNFTTAGNGTFQVIDPDMNLDPSSADSFDVHVRPAQKSGIDLSVTETGKATGIFEGIIFFTTDSPSDGELEVELGDIVTGTYKDHTLPLPDDITTSMSIEVMVEILEPIVINSTGTNSTGTNSTDTNSTDTAKDKSTTDKPQDAKPKTAQKSDDKPQDTKPKTTSKPDDEPRNDAEPSADPKPKADPKPTADKPTDPKPAPVQSTVDPDLVRCGPGTELVGGVCQASRASADFDIVGWLFSWFR